MGLNLFSTTVRQARALLWCTLAASAAQAQVLDDVELRREGNDAVLQVRFVTGVQFVRSVSTRSGDQTLVFYRVLPTQVVLDPAAAERLVPPREAEGVSLPEIRVTDEPGSPRLGDERRLLLRLAQPVRHRVRAGRGDRTFEVVFEGRGAAVAQAPARAAPVQGGVAVVPPPAAALPAVPPAEPPGYRVTLASREGGPPELAAPVPAALQNFTLFTTRRPADGRDVHEVHLGPFASRAEAEAARALLLSRFPLAMVTLPSDPARGVLPPMAQGPQPAPGASAAAPAAAASAATVAAAPMAPTVPAVPVAPVTPAVPATPAAPTEPTPPPAPVAVAAAPAGAASAPAAEAAVTPPVAVAPASAADPARAAETARRRRITPTTTLVGSISAYYYGGQSKVRTQEFQDSPLSGLPELVSDATLAGTDQRQWVTSADVNWRHRDADVDQRFVFRDSYTRDELRPEKSRNRLTALYWDQRSFVNGTSFRIGRQTPLGGGVLGRFDGAQLGYAFKPRWKASVVGGVPTDTLLDARRYFYGAAVEAEALTPQLGGSLYAIEQKIDGEVDRRALGTEMRYFDGGLSGTAQLDYDVLFKGLNIASVQGTWQRPDNTVINVLYDRRYTPMLMLGNTLFFTDPSLIVRPMRVSELLATTPLEVLRERAKGITARSTQAALGFTTPVGNGWQAGADLRYTNTSAVAPVPDILPGGLPSTGDIWSVSAQLIGTNLYSARDTHVFIVNVLQGPTYKGQLVSYNNSSLLAGGWQLEPSLKWYHQSEASGIASTRWSPGLRVTYRLLQQLAIESEVSVENSRTSGPNRHENSSRTFYYLGGRYEF